MEEVVEQQPAVRKCVCGTCRTCKQRGHSQKFYEKNREKVLVRSRKRYQDHREEILADQKKQRDLLSPAKRQQRAHDAHLRRKEAWRDCTLRKQYGISLREYNEQLAAQSGVCAICKKPETVIDRRTGNPRNLSVDHCHHLLTPRALLCHECNLRIGRLEASAAGLLTDLAYLKEFNSPIIPLLVEALLRTLGEAALALPG